MAFGSFVRGIDISQSKCAWICTDERVVRAYDADPACGFTFTLNGFENLFTLMQRAYSPRGWQVKNPSLPVFFISGAQDPCRVSDRAFLKAVHFLRRRGYHQVEWKEYAAARHELLNETGKARVFADVLSFLRYHPGADKQSD